MSRSKQHPSGKARKRVLLLAYACSPYRGSEEGVGWQRALQAVRYFDTWVLYGVKTYKREIRQYLKEHGKIQGLHFVYIPESRLERLMLKLPLGYYIANNLWHRRAYSVAVKLHDKFLFDLMHQVTWCGFREPGYLWRLDVPFLWGPVGGTQNYPWRFLFLAGIKGALVEVFRSIVNMLQLRYQPRVKKAVRKASVLLTANSTGKKDFERVHKVDPVLMLETGVKAIRNSRPRYHDKPNEALKILWSGVFEGRKALHLLFMALSRVPSTFTYELRILGKGPLEKRWRKLARQTGVERQCTWTGWLPHSQALALYEWADVFVFTSLRDTSGNVALEALSYGVPVICLDHQGVSDIITTDCGIKIPVTTPREVISRLRSEIVTLAERRQKLRTLSFGAIERAKDHLWSVNGDKMAEIYMKVIENSGNQILDVYE